MAFVLIGFMGAGKTTVARELAAAAGVRAIDSDALLEERLGHPVAREFALHGEAAFRAQEEELVCEVLARAGRGEVVALGGGSVTSERVREALAGHVTVLLDVDPATAWERVHATPGGAARPLARDRDYFERLHAERSDLYEDLADAILGDLPSRAAAHTLPGLDALAAAPSGARLLWASSKSGEYPVLVARGLLDQLARSSALWPLDRSSSRSFCVSDETVAGLYGDRLGDLAGTVAIPAGEESKTLASAERVWHELVAGGMTRADHVVALGGGVVGDLAGFCAGTYQRGVPVVQVPTTLVAQVDSAYGGKTGVDLPNGKNYVGAYHQPSAVVADVDTLATLPPEEAAAGYAEVLKTALIAGGDLWERVRAGGDPDPDVIFECARTKLAVVAMDERDAGLRQVLNLGHTVGHAIETVTGYSRYRHGEAVGLGLLAALRLSGQDALRGEVAALLAARGLPTQLDDGVDPDAVLVATARDKKRRSGEAVPFVLLDAPGAARPGCQVEDGELRAAVRELSAA